MEMVEGRIKDDTRESDKAAIDFIQKMKQFGYFDNVGFDIQKLEYIFMPAIYARHYVMYVLNLKLKRYEYLTSLVGYTRTGMYEKIGNYLMKEATAYVDYKFQIKGTSNPYEWDNFKWTSPKMPQQTDKVSCGVFLMKFMEEWDGEPFQMESFKTWVKLPKKKKEKDVAQFRVNYCLEIVNHETNDMGSEVHKLAEEHGQKMLYNLVVDYKMAQEGGKTEKKQKKKGTRKK